MSYKTKLLDKYMSNLSDLDKLLYVRKLLNSCISNLKAKEKSLISESKFDYMSAPKRTANNRGGRMTSISAKASVSCKIYQDSVEDLKKTVSKL